MTRARTNQRLELMNEEIQGKYGILVNYRHVGELLDLSSPTAINGWLRKNAIEPAGRKGYYYSRDIAKAIIENGGVVA